jgi:DNA replication and repair protein RecF
LQLDRFNAQRFRNLSEIELALSPGMNVIYGENAQGKTNLLEAVFALSSLRSFRTRQLNETVQFNCDSAFLQGTLHHSRGTHLLTVAIGETGKVVTLDRKKVDPLHYLGVFNVFLFSYPLLEVIRGGPESRRRFLDRSIAMTKPAYLPVLVQYHRVIKQKTALLNSLQRGEMNRKEGTDEVRSFNDQLAQYGLQIVEERTAYLNNLQSLLREKQSLFFDTELRLGIELKSSFLGTRRDIDAALERVLEREIVRGNSLIGIHHDEMQLTIGGKELRKYGSSGQHRAFLLLLVLSQLTLYEQLREDRPVYCWMTWIRNWTREKSIHS